MLGNDLLSHRVTPTVPSALEGLTTVFGMGTGVSPPPWSPNKLIISKPLTLTPPGGRPGWGAVTHLAALLASAAAPGAEALDLASFRRRDVVRTAPHLAHEPLLLHLAAEFPKGLFELLGVFDDYSHHPVRIPIDRRRCCLGATRARPGGRP